MSSRLGIAGIVLLAAFGLAACGGGGGSGTAPDPEPTGPTQADLDAERDRADKAEEERDKLQREKDQEQAAADLKAAKALFTALRLPQAISGNPATAADTTGLTGAARTTQVSIPALGKPDTMGMFSKKVGTTQWSAQVYSTVEASTTKLLAEVLATDTNYNGTHLNFPSNPSADSNIKSPSFPQESGTRHYPAGKREFSGTYMGASGTYSCSAVTCSATWTTTGIDLSEGWVFTPADNARAVIPDGTYQSYGWWLQKNADGTMDAGPVHFTTAGAAPTSGVTVLQGSAKYEGSAAGKYAIYSGAFSERSEAGHFTADVMLEANFGGTENGRVSGKIDGFMTGNGPKDDWEVSLNASGADATDGLNDTGAFSGTTTWKIGTVSSGDSGAYSGNLYDSTKAGQDGVPYEAGGTFDAPFEGGVGEMVGAFAATRKKQ